MLFFNSNSLRRRLYDSWWRNWAKPHVMGLSSRPQGQSLKSAALPSGSLALLRRLASKASLSSHVYGIRFCSSKLGYSPFLMAWTKDGRARFSQHAADWWALLESGECVTNIHGRTHPEGPETCSTIVNKCSLVMALWIIESWSPVLSFFSSRERYWWIFIIHSPHLLEQHDFCSMKCLDDSKWNIRCVTDDPGFLPSLHLIQYIWRNAWENPGFAVSIIHLM